jgi:hypothetical protein
MNIIEKLPIELKDHIYSLIRYEKPEILLDDIKNVYLFKTIYRNAHQMAYHDEGNEEVINWMINNLELYIELYCDTDMCDQYLSRVYGNHEKYKHILKTSNNFQRNINLIISILTIDERIHMMFKLNLIQWLSDEDKKIMYDMIKIRKR